MPLRILYLDMNSYFASCEQHLRPELRGKPVVVVPMNVDSTSCIAASIEAKKLGVRTGTPVWEARQKNMIIVESRTDQYVDIHHKILKAIDTCIPVQEICSIDEMYCRLSPAEAEAPAAIALGERVKQAIRKATGESMKCSIGLAPNRLIAKIGTDLEKPNGLKVLTETDLPYALYEMKLRDFPGVGPNMVKRLNYASVTNAEELCNLSIERMRAVWNGVVGERWWNYLRGHDVTEIQKHKSSVGNSKVLSPELRNHEKSHDVLIRLIHKAGARLRRMQYWANHLHVHVSLASREDGWNACAALGTCQDTQTMIDAFESVWPQRLAGTPLKVGVTLSGLVPHKSAHASLFPKDQQRLRLSHAMDAINQKFGQHSVYMAGMHGMTEKSPSPIAFTSIPELEDIGS